MALFLKAVSGLYLILIWLVVALVFASPVPALAGTVGSDGLAKAILLLVAVGLSIPAAVLFGFAQIVGDVRTMRSLAKSQNDHLTAMRRYYEPQGR